MNKTNRSNKDSIFYKLANHRFQDRNALFSFNDFIFFFIVSPLMLIGSLYVLITSILTFDNGFIFSLILRSCIALLCLLFVFLNLKINQYAQLNDYEITSMYEQIKENKTVLLKARTLHKKQGFILKKQKKELLKELKEDSDYSNQLQSKKE